MATTYSSTVPSNSWLLRFARWVSTTGLLLRLGERRTGENRFAHGFIGFRPERGDDLVELGCRTAECEPADFDHGSPVVAARRTDPHSAAAGHERDDQTEDRQDARDQSRDTARVMVDGEGDPLLVAGEGDLALAVGKLQGLPGGHRLLLGLEPGQLGHVELV